VAAISTAGVISIFTAAGCMNERAPEEDAEDAEDQRIQETEGQALVACSYETCGHPKCSMGQALLNPACDPCVQKVCNFDGNCCGMDWGQYCVDLVESLCTVSCDEGYQIQSKSTGQCFSTPSPDVTTSVFQVGCSNAADQRFFLSYANWGRYNIVAEQSDLCLLPDPWAHSNLEAGLMQIDCPTDGSVYLVSVGSGYYIVLDIYFGFCYESDAGGGVHLSECDGGSNQKFRFYAKN
jgi:hypothetical protein